MAGKISDMTAAVAVADADQVEVLQGGVNKRATSILFVTAAKIATALGYTPANAASVPVKATGAEIDTGTDDAKFATAKAIEDSLYIKAAYADAKVADAINDGTTTIAPSQNAVFDALAAKQATLVSGTNIKTVNGTTLLGSGDLVVSGGSIDGSGTAGRGARWTDADTLAAGGVRDDGTRAGIGADPDANATLTVKAQTGDTECLRIEGTGGVITPTVLFEHAGQTGVKVTGDNTGFQFANDGEGVTLYVVPGYAEAYIKTHPSSPGRLNFQSHDGADYITVLAVKGGKAQLWDGSALVDVSIGAADSAGAGFRLVRVPN